VNKPINLHYFYSCIHIFYFSVLFFIFYGLGPAQPIWAGLDPARSLAQASDPAGQKSKKARMK